MRKKVLWKCKESHRKFEKENFCGIPKSSDTKRSLENIFKKFQKFGPWFKARSSQIQNLKI